MIKKTSQCESIQGLVTSAASVSEITPNPSPIIDINTTDDPMTCNVLNRSRRHSSYIKDNNSSPYFNQATIIVEPTFVISDVGDDPEQSQLCPPFEAKTLPKSVAMVILNGDKATRENPAPSSFNACWQIFLAVLIAACGNFIAGLILDQSKTWKVFIYTPELYYLVPILLSLKGNLEMTMVARLSTLANMGILNDFRSIFKVLRFNICLVQTQAIVVSFLASIVTLIALKIECLNDDCSLDHWIPDQALIYPQQPIINCTLINQELLNHYNGTSQTRKVLLIFSTSIITANVACFISTILMIMFTVLLSCLKINPDNFVTALAASFGDIITSFLIGVFGEYINNNIAKTPAPDNVLCPGINYYDDLQSPWMAVNLIIGFLLLVPFLVFFTIQDRSSREILLGLDAWIPILLSMLIAFISGLVLRFGAVAFNFMNLFQPLINGVGGNMAAITTSRYSTELHLESHLNSNGSCDNSPPAKAVENFRSVIRRTFNSFLNLKDHKNIMILVFLMMAIVVHLFYGILAPIIHQMDHHQITWLFYVFYVPATVIQALILLVITRFFVEIVWWMKYDPDTSAIPILTSIGDFLGTVLLYLVFCILRSLGDASAAPPLTGSNNNINLNQTNSNVFPGDQTIRSITNNIHSHIITSGNVTSALFSGQSSPSPSPSSSSSSSSSVVTNNLASFLFISYVVSAAIPYFHNNDQSCYDSILPIN